MIIKHCITLLINIFGKHFRSFANACIFTVENCNWTLIVGCVRSGTFGLTLLTSIREQHLDSSIQNEAKTRSNRRLATTNWLLACECAANRLVSCFALCKRSECSFQSCSLVVSRFESLLVSR